MTAPSTLPGEEPGSASVAREGSAVDAWTYVVALASDGAIDQPGAIGVFADSAELPALQEAVTARRAAEARASRQKLRQALTTANQDRAGLRAAVQTAAMEKAQLQRELNETVRWLRQLEDSRSWRITRPLRAAGAAFRRLSPMTDPFPKTRSLTATRAVGSRERVERDELSAAA